MRKGVLLAAAATFSLVPSAVSANDSAAGLDGGELVLKKAEGIRMQSEDLFISMKEVRVRYAFRNETAADIETIVAFPLPPMITPAELESGEANVTYDPKSDNPLHFVCTVDGKPVKIQTDKKTVKDEVHITHYWTQRFPAGKTVIVEHSYKPSLWQTYAPEPTPEATRTYCIDGGTRKAIAAIARTDEVKVYFSNSVNYILKTARSWSGPIGDFHLTIDKGDPKNVISLCIDGIKKTGPTRFEARKKDFVPDRDLAILFATTRDRAAK